MRIFTLSFLRTQRTWRMACIILLGFIPTIIFGQTEISTVQGLKDIAQGLSGNYKLTADLTLTEEWVSIGTEAAPFTGTLDGNGYKITDLKINKSETNIVGLFGMAKGARFENIALENVSVIGNQNAGGIVGKAISINMNKCYVTGIIDGRDHVAPLVGGVYAGEISNITNCYSTATVTTRGFQVAGLLGVASSTKLENCYFAGTIACTTPQLAWNYNAGGLIALTEDANVTINTCVSAASSIVGGTSNPYIARGSGTLTSMITNCLYRSDMSVSIIDNGTFAQPNAADARDLSALTSESTYTGLTWDFSTIWSINEGQFPTLKGVGTTTGVNSVTSEIAKYYAYTSHGKLIVKGISNATISVFNVNGELIAKKESASVQSEINLTTKGVYLVRVTENAKTALLKVIL